MQLFTWIVCVVSLVEVLYYSVSLWDKGNLKLKQYALFAGFMVTFVWSLSYIL